MELTEGEFLCRVSFDQRGFEEWKKVFAFKICEIKFEMLEICSHGNENAKLWEQEEEHKDETCSILKVSSVKISVLF
jgi:hypothetical protein